MLSPKRVSAAILTLLFGLLSFTLISAQTATVATWHVGKTGAIPQDRLVRIAEAIGRLDPDIIVLEGLSDGSVATDIRNRLVGYTLEILPQTSARHIAILYRSGTSVTNPRLIPGSDDDKHLFPKALAATVKIGDLDFLLIGIQMTSSPLGDQIQRHRQARAIATFIRSQTQGTDKNVVVVGAYSMVSGKDSQGFAALSPGSPTDEFLRYLSAERLKGKISIISRCSSGKAVGTLADLFATSKNIAEKHVTGSLRIVDFKHSTFAFANGRATCDQYLKNFANHLPLIATFRIGPSDDSAAIRQPLNPRHEIFPRVVTRMPDTVTRLDSLADFDKLTREQQIRHLDLHGPFLPREHSFNDFSMRAFVRGNWKLVLSYTLRPDASAVVTIDSNGVDPLSRSLKPGTDQQVIIEIPDRFGPELQPGKISIATTGKDKVNAFDLDYIAVMPENTSGASVVGPASFEANHLVRAIDSRLGIRPLTQQGDLPVVRFDGGIRSIRTSLGESITYGFTLAQEYDGASASFDLITTDAQDAVVPVTVFTEEFGRVKEIHDQKWNGMNEEGKFSYGRHKLVIRAWYGYKNGGPWYGPKIGPRVRVEQ